MGTLESGWEGVGRREEGPSESPVGAFGSGVRTHCLRAEMWAHLDLARVDVFRSEGPSGGRVEQALTPHGLEKQ